MRLWTGLGIIALYWLATPVFGGAWLRERGHGFTATSTTWTMGGNGYFGYYSSYYGEFGLSDRLTLGIDAGVGENGIVTALIFTRLPLWQGKNGGRLALEMASGTTGQLPVMRPGVSWGRGLETPWGPGWLSVDTSAALNTVLGITTYKMDGTIGVSPSDRWKAILQVQTQVQPGISQSLKIAPSAVMRVGKHMQFEIGTSHALMGTQMTGVKLGVWVDF